MCTNPKRIMNRSKSLHNDHMKRYILVPCGQCDECRQQLQQDWTLRTEYEVRKYREKGGEVIYATLTYDSKYLPCFDYSDKEGEYHVPCFNHQDLRKFLRCMWNHFARGECYDVRYKNGRVLKSPIFEGKQPYVRNEDLPLKYIAVSEFGMDPTRTRRPHYHIEIFLPPELVGHFNNDNRIHRFLRRCWPYGFVRKNPDFGWFIDGDNASQYVCKYITKDMEFFSNPKVDEFLNGYDDELNEVHRYLFKKHLPKHFQSMGFGSGLSEEVTDRDFFDGIDFHFSSDIRNGRAKLYRVPRYIRRKTLYMKNENGQEVLNERGIQVELSQLEERIQKFAERVKKLSETDEMMKRTSLHNVDYTKIYNRCGVDSGVGLSAFIYEKMRGRSYLELAAYALIWRDTFFPSDSKVGSSTIELLKSPLTTEDFMLLTFDHYVEGILNRGSCEYHPEGVFWSYLDDMYPVYCEENRNLQCQDLNLPRFEYFDDILDIITDVGELYNANRAKNITRRFVSIRKTKGLLRGYR